MDEINMIKRCQSGDRDAFRRLVEGYRRLVFSVALRMTGCEEAAKDIVQETFIRVWLNVGKFELGRSLRTWIYTIAVRLCLDALESKRVAVGNEAALNDFLNDRTPDRHLENKELAAVINALAERLSAKQRAVFTLVCLEGLETAEVAAITGLDAAKIKSNLYVARKTIKEQLKVMGYE